MLQSIFPRAGKRSFGIVNVFRKVAKSTLHFVTPRAAFAADRARVLVLFYSWSGQTRAFAGEIRARTGGDMAEIEPVSPYTKNYSECVRQARKEVAEKRFSSIRPVSADVSAYDVIFIGSPNWCGTWAGPVQTFLRGESLAGKNVIPFNTHGGGGWQSMLDDLGALCPDAKRLEGLSIRDGEVKNSGGAIDSWLRRVGLAR